MGLRSAIKCHMEANKTIQVGQTLKARSICDGNCEFTAEVLERNKSFVTVKAQGIVRRVKVHNTGDGEFIYAHGRHSMAPVFRAP